MELIITDNMIIQFITGGTEYTLSKMVFSDNGVEHEVYNSGSTPSHDYSQDYFTIEMLDGSNATLSFNTTTKTTNLSSFTLYYSINDAEWQSVYFGNYSSASIGGLKSGDKIRLKATTNRWGGASNAYKVIGEAKNGNTVYHYNVYGNILSLLYGDDFTNYSELKNYDYIFTYLFGPTATSNVGNTSIVSAENLVFPEDTKNYCYMYMFKGCTSLTTPPKILPCITLVHDCYNCMFAYCSALTGVPSLPATTLANYCYNNMFMNCTGLTTIPTNLLPANTLTYGCYSGMFQACTSLTNAPNLPAENLQQYCYSDMFFNCKALVNIPSTLPATTLYYACYSEMFMGCSSLTSVPTLPATTLQGMCYKRMFSGCSALETVPSNLLPATTLQASCYEEMFYNCSNLTIAPDLLATTLVNYCYKQMFRYSTKLTYLKCLATSISATDCVKDWLAASSSGTFVKDANTTWPEGTSGIPSSWTIQNA